MELIIGLLLGIISCALIHRNHGRWYEYMCAVILTVLACVGLMMV